MSEEPAKTETSQTPGSIEGWLDKVKDSGITWLVVCIVGLTVAGALNARGLFDDVAAIKNAESKFESSQSKVNENQGQINRSLLDSLARQDVTNQKLQDQVDMLRSMFAGKR